LFGFDHERREILMIIFLSIAHQMSIGKLYFLNTHLRDNVDIRTSSADRFFIFKIL